MGNGSVIDWESLINRQMKAQGKIELCLMRIKELMDEMKIPYFSVFPRNLSRQHFFLADNILKEAIQINHASLKELFEALASRRFSSSQKSRNFLKIPG